MMEYLSHSAKGDCPSQSYAEHIDGVYRRASKYAEEAEAYADRIEGQLKNIVQSSAKMHDLGKLDDANQAALQDTANKRCV